MHAGQTGEPDVAHRLAEPDLCPARRDHLQLDDAAVLFLIVQILGQRDGDADAFGRRGARQLRLLGDLAGPFLGFRPAFDRGNDLVPGPFAAANRDRAHLIRHIEELLAFDGIDRERPADHHLFEVLHVHRDLRRRRRLYVGHLDVRHMDLRHVHGDFGTVQLDLYIHVLLQAEPGQAPEQGSAASQAWAEWRALLPVQEAPHHRPCP